jgi:Domain of unknown function (DUF362)
MAIRPTRRQVLGAGATWLSSAALTGCLGTAFKEAGKDEAIPKPSGADASTVSGDASDASHVPMKPAPGTVIETFSANAIRSDVIQSGSVAALMTAGMLALTGATSECAAWRTLFGPSDIVGIKVNPTGFPAVYTNPETLLEIIRGLGLAGVPPEQIVVFDRYRDMLNTAGYERILPQGVRILAASDKYEDNQTGTSGYDINEYVDIARVMPGDDVNIPRHRRSHLCTIVSQTVTKVINVPNLKDHISAGITMALKNMVYGSVNNVARTHAAPDNWTRDFIPAVLGIRTLREKYVLHIADALFGCFDGGPTADNPNFKKFVYGALLFSTDPVAMDRIGWKILDEKRTAAGLPVLEESGLSKVNRGFEAFDARQPEHVICAGNAGYGIADMGKITHRRIELA